MRTSTAGLRSPLLLALALATSCSAPPDATTAQRPVSSYTGPALEFDGDGVLVVAAWAEWAPVWKLLAPEVQKYQESSPDGVEFQYLLVDDNREAARQLGATTVPSIVLIRQKKVVAVLPNLTTEDQLAKEVSRWLSREPTVR